LPVIFSKPMSILRRMIVGLATVTALIAPALTAAQSADWPTRPIKLIVAYPPGGGTNAVARVLADQLTKSLGQPVIVDNRPGGNGIIGTVATVRAEPDGYTFMFATGASLTGAMVTVKSLPYDTLRDLAPITLVGNGPYLLVANPAFPPNTLPEMIAYAKARPGQINYASPGSSSVNFFLAEMLNIAAGIKTTHVPYKGSSAILTDLMAGHVQYTLDTPGSTLAQIRSGKLKVIAALSNERLSKLPNVPTMVELGYPSVVGGSWYGLVAPAKTPKPIIARMHAAVVAALKVPEVRKAFEDRDVIPGGNTPEEFTRFIQAELAKWGDLTNKLGIKPE
jgi:tripartite-type tricarboxylate transporter receptor subunit TctC